jgi:uncharacterized protein (UPF0332 family)
MDEAVKRAYVALHLGRAHDDLATAHDNLVHSHWRGAVNRAYYAIFHAASAALLWLGIERARHSGIQAAFGEFLVKPGIIELRFGQTYARARQMREEQDYDLQAAPLAAGDAEQMVSEADRFLARIEDYLRQVAAMD